VSMLTGQTDRQTDGRALDRYIVLSAMGESAGAITSGCMDAQN